MPDRKRLLVSRRFPDAVLARAERDYEARINRESRTLSREELGAWCRNADAALISVSDKFDRAFIAELPARLRIISTFSVGIEHIDLAAARDKGLRVGNAPHGVTIATAEIAMLLILGAARRAAENGTMLSQRRWVGWEPTQLLGRRLDGKVLGILGMGKIGQALARRARAFDMVIHYCNRSRLAPAEEQGAIYHSSFESLAAVSDIVSLNAPSTPETRQIVNARSLAQFKPGAMLVNTARGDLVNDDDLIAALRSGRISQAGLDVFQGEPRINEAYYGLPNVFMLPHIGSAAVEARDQMGFEALDNIDAFFAGRELPFAVA